jgi:HD-GYP domain-containing protein (c-di-GMP phosphodiesterase class II)
MYYSNYEKIEIVFFYKPLDLNIQHQNFVRCFLDFRMSDIQEELNPIRVDNEKIKIYVMTPGQLIDNHERIREYFQRFKREIVYGIILVDETEHDSTVIRDKKIDKYREEFRIILELKAPYTKSQIVNEFLIAVEHIYLYSNKETFRELLSLREVEGKAINDISRAMITGSEFSSENLIQLILKKSIEISASDAGFVILKEDTFNGAQEMRLDSSNNEIFNLIQFAKITENQNIDLCSENIDSSNFKLAQYLFTHGTSVSWHEGDDDTLIRGKNQFIARSIPEFIFNKESYKVKSYCAFPIRKPGADVDGFIILFNKKISKYVLLESLEDIDNNVVSYSLHELNLLESLANQAGVSFAHGKLITDLRKAFESFTAASITAIESRDPSTKGHSERVATLTVGLADAVNKVENGIYCDTNFNRHQMEEIRYASLLHDFGKIGVREHVLQKEKKLFSFQLERIHTRFESIKDKLYINILENYIEKLMQKNEAPSSQTLEKYKQELYKVSQELEEFWHVILELNEPSVVNREIFDKIAEIAAMEVMVGNKNVPILTPSEINVLTIKRGSLSVQERIEIESHVTHSYNFLVQIPWTPEFKRIPEIVYGHHERLDGSGYPRNLIAKDIPIQAKMMAITDIFDALVAQDRPYKKAMPVDRALTILEAEVRAGKLDAELLRLFIEAKVFELIKKTSLEYKATG